MMTYTTKYGDTWDVIADKCYGSTSYTGRLIMANIRYAQYMYFPTGIALDIPDVETADVPTPVPWKEVKG
jgi:phage tail protein X